MRLRTALFLAFALAVQPAGAQDGFLDRLFGGSGGAPPNPFASNYSSASPSAEAVRVERQRRAARTARAAPEGGPVPPARIPE